MTADEQSGVTAAINGLTHELKSMHLIITIQGAFINQKGLRSDLEVFTKDFVARYGPD